MEEKVNAITLKSVDIGESDKLLTLFTLEKGIITALAKGVKKDKAKLKFVSEPFCFSEIVISEKLGRRSITGASCHKSYFNICQDLNAYFSACVMAEFICLFFKDVEDEMLFASIISALENMLKKVSFSSLVKVILIGLNSAGYGLDFSGCSACGEEISSRVFLDVDASSFLCENCVRENGIEFKISTYRRLLYLNQTGFSLLEEEQEDTKNCLKLLDLYIYNRIGFRLKSLEFLL